MNRDDLRRTRQIARAISRPARRRVTTVTKGLEFPYRAASTPRAVAPLPQRGSVGTDYDTEWARTPPARAAREMMIGAVMRPLVAGLARPQRRGLDRLADLDGPVIFATNHKSHIDTPLLLTSIPQPWRSELVVGAAADYFFATRITGAMSALAIGAFPIERSRVGRRSADLARSLIDDGWSLLIYPEGGRSKDGWGQPFRGGAGYLGVRCGVPIVPVYLDGTDRILRKGRLLPRRSATVVVFGDAILPSDDESARSLGARIEQAVGELGDEITSDWWQARQRRYRNATPSMSGPDAASWRRAWALGDRRPRSRRRRRAWPQLS